MGGFFRAPRHQSHAHKHIRRAVMHAHAYIHGVRQTWAHVHMCIHARVTSCFHWSYAGPTWSHVSVERGKYSLSEPERLLACFVDAAVAESTTFFFALIPVKKYVEYFFEHAL